MQSKSHSLVPERQQHGGAAGVADFGVTHGAVFIRLVATACRKQKDSEEKESGESQMLQI
eukprot:COSAG04_NODE_596_length_12255_cov_4.614018_3_plen_60_part_00